MEIEKQKIFTRLHTPLLLKFYLEVPTTTHFLKHVRALRPHLRELVEEVLGFGGSG